MEVFVIMAIVLGIPTILAWIYKTTLEHKRFMKVLELKAEVNSRLLDRVGSDPAALEILRSDIQKRLFDVKMPDGALGTSLPYSRMLTAAQAAFVLLSLGAGFLISRGFFDQRDEQEPFLVFGTLGLSLGVGTLLSAVAAFAAAKLWPTGQEAS